MRPPAMIVRLGVIALLATAPLWLSTFRVLLLTEILILGLFAASLDLLIGYSGLLSLGHAGYLGVGSFGAALIAKHVTSNAFAQVAVATVAAAAVAAGTGLIAVRSRGVYFLMLTLAFGQLLFLLAFNWVSVTGGSNGISGFSLPSLGGSHSGVLLGNTNVYYYVLVAFLLGYALLKLIVSSPFGRALTGIRENEARMSSLGYNTVLYKLAVFTIAGGLAGYAGALAVQQQRVALPDPMSFDQWSSLAVIVLIIGGQRSLLGPVIGAGVYYVINDQLSSLLSSHWPLLLGVVFMLVVYLLPGGLVGVGRTLRAWALARLPGGRPPAPVESTS